MLVLTIGGVVGALILRNRETHSGGDADERWSAAWLHGHEEAWSLDPPSGLGGEVSVETVGGRLIRSLSGPDTATISVFDLESGSPQLMWEKEIHAGLSWLDTWEDRILTGDTLLDINTGEPTQAPWPADAGVTTSRRGAVACVETTCTMWTSLTDKQWETTLPGSGTATVSQGTRVEDHGQAYVSEGKETSYFAIDLNTGSSKAIATQGSSLPPQPLADGWLIYASSPASSQRPDTEGAYEPDGTPVKTYSSDLSKEIDTYPWSPTRFTPEQARKWFHDADTSWAPGTYSMDAQDSSCESITVQGQRIALGPDNAIVTSDRGDRGACRLTAPVQARYHSGDGQIAAFRTTQGTQTSLVLVEMTTGRVSEPISLGDYSGYIPEGDLLISCTKDGKVTAHRPTGS